MRVLRNLDPAGRGRAIQRAGSEAMPLFCPSEEIALDSFFGGPGRRLELHSCKASYHSAPISIKLGGITVPKLSIEELGRRYACQLGHDDYPATTSCPYSRSKSPGLYASYWNRWDAAGAEYWRARRCADQVANNRTVA